MDACSESLFCFDLGYNVSFRDQLSVPCQTQSDGGRGRLCHHTSPTTVQPNSSQVAGSGTGVARKPCCPVGASSKVPTIRPASLIPNACVENAPGTSIVVKVAPF